MTESKDCKDKAEVISKAMDAQESARCDFCGRRRDRPTFDPDCTKGHPKASPADLIVEAIERQLRQRKRVCWTDLDLDSDIEDEIRDDLVQAVWWLLD